MHRLLRLQHAGRADAGRGSNEPRALQSQHRPAAHYAWRDSGTRRLRSSDTDAELASQMRVAFSSMAWNTGSNSPGELEMTFSTSAVAVCCSSDSQIVGALAQLVEQPRVLDGDDRLGGEVLHQLDLLVGERTDLLAIDGDGADQLLSLQHRHGNVSARRHA